MDGPVFHFSGQLIFEALFSPLLRHAGTNKTGINGKALTLSYVFTNAVAITDQQYSSVAESRKAT